MKKYLQITPVKPLSYDDYEHLKLEYESEAERKKAERALALPTFYKS